MFSSRNKFSSLVFLQDWFSRLFRVVIFDFLILKANRKKVKKEKKNSRRPRFLPWSPNKKKKNHQYLRERIITRFKGTKQVNFYFLIKKLKIIRIKNKRGFKTLNQKNKIEWEILFDLLAARTRRESHRKRERGSVSERERQKESEKRGSELKELKNKNKKKFNLKISYAT